MDNSTNQTAWYSYFAENMQQLGIPVPATWPGGSQGVLVAIKQLIAASDKSAGGTVDNPAASGLTDVDASLRGVLGHVNPGYLASAALGSAAVAARRCWACGTQLIDVIGYAQQNTMWSHHVAQLLAIHPEIYDRSRPNREVYGRIAKAKA